MANPNRRAAITTCWGFVTFFAILAVVAAVLIRPEPGLLDHGTRLADAGRWVPSYGGYFWLNKDRILTFQPTGPGVRAISIRVGTGEETVLPELSQALASAGTSVSSWRASPDGTA